MVRVKLLDWMKANPSVIPTHTIWVVSHIGYNVMFDGKFIEFTKDEVIISNKIFFKLKGKLDTAEIEIPLSYLRERETIRQDNIDEIIS